LAHRRGLTFDQSFMCIQAAIEGLGVALGRSAFVEADIAQGRLVVPFDVVLPAEAGFYIVAPEETADDPKIALFRDWLMKSVIPGAKAPPQAGRPRLFATIQTQPQRTSQRFHIPCFRNDDCFVRRKIPPIPRFISSMRLDRYRSLGPLGPAPIHVLVCIALGLVAITTHHILQPILMASHISLGFEKFGLVRGPYESASIQRF
jgi:hypothetical protein